MNMHPAFSPAAQCFPCLNSTAQPELRPAWKVCVHLCSESQLFFSVPNDEHNHTLQENSIVFGVSRPQNGRPVVCFWSLPQVDLGPVLQPLCRHSMVVAHDTCLIFGGYDGATASNQLLQINLQPVLQLQRSSLQDLISCMACCGGGSGRSICSVEDETGSDTSRAPKAKAAAAAEALVGVHLGDEALSVGTLKAVGVVPRAAVLPVPPVVKALSKKASPPPLKLSDLPNAEEVAAMPQWKQVRQLHQVRA